VNTLSVIPAPTALRMHATGQRPTNGIAQSQIQKSNSIARNLKEPTAGFLSHVAGLKPAIRSFTHRHWRSTPYDFTRATTIWGTSTTVFAHGFRTRKSPTCEAEIGRGSATLWRLGVLSLRLRRKLQWSRETEQFWGDDVPNHRLRLELREPWS
jgi:hypothetical protein